MAKKTDTAAWTPWSSRFYEVMQQRYPEHVPDDYKTARGRKRLVERGADALRKMHDLRKLSKADMGKIIRFLLYEDDFYLPTGNMKTLHKLDARTKDGDQRHYEVVRSKMAARQERRQEKMKAARRSTQLERKQPSGDLSEVTRFFDA